MKVAFLLLVFFKISIAFDFIRQSLRYINQSSDPCDNFFRHACSYGEYGDLSDNMSKKIEADFFKNRKPRAWDNLSFVKAISNVLVAEVPENATDFFVEYFESLCEDNENTNRALEKMEAIIHKTMTPDCNFVHCLTSLSLDLNCNRSANLLREHITEKTSDYDSNPDFVSFLEDFWELTEKNLNGISLLIERDLRAGVEFIDDTVLNMVELVTQWIPDTPWIKNHSLTGLAVDLASQLKYSDNFGKILEEVLDELMKMEMAFSKCMLDVGETGELLCLYYTAKTLKTKLKFPRFFNYFNAYNGHPKLSFGFPFLEVATSSVLSAKLGYVGFVAGHEVSHTLIEDPRVNKLFPAFSEEAIQCVQDQYNSTCQEFKEIACGVSDIQIDENGSDVLGAQLAYALLEENYKDLIKEEYVKLNQISITHQQLFFYSAAFTFCHSRPMLGHELLSHSAGNIRINALAQLPGFQDAFQCSPDSRMMRTVEKQCHIFGENAPAQRK